MSFALTRTNPALNWSEYLVEALKTRAPRRLRASHRIDALSCDVVGGELLKYFRGQGEDFTARTLRPLSPDYHQCASYSDG